MERGRSTNRARGSDNTFGQPAVQFKAALEPGTFALVWSGKRPLAGAVEAVARKFEHTISLEVRCVPGALGK